MNEVMIVILAYLAGGFITASVVACILKDRDDHLMDVDYEILVWVFTFWPIVALFGILAAPVLVVMSISTALYERVKWVRRSWDSLPDRSDLYPVEWLLCWPVKLYELWRKIHEREGREHEHEQ